MKRIISKKSFFIIFSSVLLLFLLYLSFNVFNEHSKMKNLFTPVKETSEYIPASESKRLSFKYDISIEELEENEYFDKLTYNIIVENDTNKKLEDFIIIFRFEPVMKDYIPSPFFYVEPVTLNPKGKDINIKNYATAYHRVTKIRKISSLKESEKKVFYDHVDRLYMDIEWDNGSEKLFLQDSNKYDSTKSR